MVLRKTEFGPMFDCILKTKSFVNTRCWSSVNQFSRVFMNTCQRIPSILMQDHYLGQKWYLGWMIKLLMSNKTKNIIPLGKVSTSFGKLLKYACLIASVADILFLGTHYRTNIAMQLWLLQQIAVILFHHVILVLSYLQYLESNAKLIIMSIQMIMQQYNMHFEQQL